MPVTQQPQSLTRLGDIDPARFTICAYCEARGHSAPVDREKVSPDVETGPALVLGVQVQERSIPDRVHGGGKFEYREG